jgi:hypothetical protein
VTEFAAGGTFDEHAVMRCRDGEALCDFDDVPGQCTFHIAACFLGRDERFSACHPNGATISRVFIDGDRAVGGIAGFTGAVGALGGRVTGKGVVLFDPPLIATNDLSPTCSRVTPLVVRARNNRMPAEVRIVTILSDGRRERSALALDCAASDAPRWRPGRW